MNDAQEFVASRYAVRSYAEVAAAVGLSPLRVYQIEQRALLKLRREFKRRGVDSVDGLPRLLVKTHERL
jgi:DNA-directed RNA polymerase specialized sigma24 family protein